MRKLEKLPPTNTLPPSTPESVKLRPETRRTLVEILSRDTQAQASPEDVVATALEVFNIITRHLSRKGSSVILHTTGESIRTLHLPNFGGAKPIRQRMVLPPKRSSED